MLLSTISCSPDQPPNNDEPYSWSQNKPYFHQGSNRCPAGAHAGEGGGWCSTNDESLIYDISVANSTIEYLQYAVANQKQQQKLG